MCSCEDRQSTSKRDDHTKHAVSCSDSKTIPWNLKELFNSPRFIWIDTESHIRSILYEGLSYQGNPMNTFAYYSTPGLVTGDRSKDKDLPAVVLIHSWGSSATPQWVELWARRGYAAISMDLNGLGPDRKRLDNAGPPAQDYMSDVWNYHGLARIVLAHSLIRSFPEVDEDRTAITGVSVGGHLVCSVIGIDTRFKAAVPVYGCGFLHEIDNWIESDTYRSLSEKQKSLWKEMYDPSNFIGYAHTHVLFIAGTNDNFYPLDKLVKTYKLFPGEKDFLIFPSMPHDFTFGVNLPEVAVFIEAHLRKGTPLASFSSIRTVGDEIHADCAAGLKLSRAYLHYTTDSGSYVNRRWRSREARIQGKDIIVSRPKKPYNAWFLTVTDTRNCTVSSEIFFAGKESKL